MDKFISRQSHTSLFLGLKIISFVIVFGSFFFQVDYSILRDATSTTAGTSYFPYILWLCRCVWRHLVATAIFPA
ncbi:hypothetical protein ACNKHX_22770 [Shigella flexneri]